MRKFWYRRKRCFIGSVFLKQLQIGYSEFENNDEIYLHMGGFIELTTLSDIVNQQGCQR